MSSLSDFARGGAAGPGTESTGTSPSGSHLQGARSGLLPTIAPATSLGTMSLGDISGGGLLGTQSLTAGGTRANSIATPRQLDSFMHGVEQPEQGDSTPGDWHDAMESTTGSMGGEYQKGVVRVFVIVEGAGKDVCCGAIGSNGARFCTSKPSECSFKSHVDKKAMVKARHVYLGTDSGRKVAGWTSWCMPLEVFGGREAQLASLGLDGPQFRRFGETLQGMYAGGKISMATTPWTVVLDEIRKPLDYGATPSKVQFRPKDEDVLDSTGLSNWFSHTPTSVLGEEGAEGSLDKSPEEDYRVLEQVTNVTANAEVLKTAIEQLANSSEKATSELGGLVKALSSQVHDVSVRLGNNPGFVGSPHDSAWDGITVLQGEMEAMEKRMEKTIGRRVADSLNDMMEAWEKSGRMQTLVSEEVARVVNKSTNDRDRIMLAQVKAVQIKNLGLEGNISSLSAELQDLKNQMASTLGLSNISSLSAELQDLKRQMATTLGLSTEVQNMRLQIASLPPNFNGDWKLVFDFFMRNTKAANPPRVGGGPRRFCFQEHE